MIGDKKKEESKFGKSKTMVGKNGETLVMGADGKWVEVDKDGNPIKSKKGGSFDKNGNWVADS